MLLVRQSKLPTVTMVSSCLVLPASRVEWMDVLNVTLMHLATCARKQ